MTVNTKKIIEEAHAQVTYCISIPSHRACRHTFSTHPLIHLIIINPPSGLHGRVNHTSHRGDGDAIRITGTQPTENATKNPLVISLLIEH